MKTCLVWVLINCSGFAATWAEFSPKTGLQTEGKIRRVRSKAIRLNRPPRYKLTNHTSGRYPGSRIENGMQIIVHLAVIQNLRLPMPPVC
jgi:hypothetical protein